MNAFPSFFAWCRCRFPATVNDPSPQTPTRTPGSPTIHPPYDGTGPFKERLCYVTMYNQRTEEAVIYLGSTNPRYPQRFVPIEPRTPLATQIQPALRTEPYFFNPPGGHLNVSHPIRAAVYFPLTRDDMLDENPPVDVVPTAPTCRLTPADEERFHRAVSSYQQRCLRYQPAPALPPPPPPSDGAPEFEPPGAQPPGSTAPLGATYASVARQGTTQRGSSRRRTDGFRPSCPEELWARYATPDSLGPRWEGGEFVGGVDWPSSDDEDFGLRVDTNVRPPHARPCLELRLCGADARFSDERDVVDDFWEEAWTPVS